MTSPALRIKRGAYSNLPGLQSGEPGFTTDKYDLFVGSDGTSLGNKFFGSARNWIRETGSVGGSLKLYEGSTNGNSAVILKSPDSIDGNQYYTLPLNPQDNYYLKTNVNGDLTWVNILQDIESILSQSLVVGFATFTKGAYISSTTDSYNTATGALVVNGGVGIGSNLNVGNDVNVGNNLYVAGVSTFVGTATFQGGTINLGDSNTDNINVVGEFISNLTPNTTGIYDVGIGTQQWRNAYFTGIGSFASGVLANNISAGVLDPNLITTVSGPLTIGASNNSVTVDADLKITDRLVDIGISTDPPSDTTWDVGVLFNYYKSNQNKRSGIFWHDSTGRIGIASHIPSVINEFGALTSDPQVDTSTVVWAPIEVGALWVTDCAGTSQVISCTGTERLLQNISIDCGVF